MEQNTNSNSNYRNGERDQPFDLEDIYKKQGMVLGKGLRGNYRKTKMARFGFFVLGIISILVGFAFIIVGIELPSTYHIEHIEWQSFYYYLIAIGSMTIGIFLIKNCFRKDNLRSTK